MAKFRLASSSTSYMISNILKKEDWKIGEFYINYLYNINIPKDKHDILLNKSRQFRK